MTGSPSEFVSTGEETDDRRRAGMLDEALDIVTGAWSGRTVQHRGDHYLVDGIRFLPRPMQTPGVPVWVAGTAGAARPMQRAARYDGYVPIELSGPDQLAEAVAKDRRAALCGRDEAPIGPTTWSSRCPSTPTPRRTPKRGRPGGCPSSTRPTSRSPRSAP